MYTKVVTLVLLFVLLATTLLSTVLAADSAPSESKLSPSYVDLFKGDVDFNHEQYFDSNVVYKLPDTVEEDELISIILKTDMPSVLDAYDNSKTELSLADFLTTEEAKSVVSAADEKADEVLATLDGFGIEYMVGETYETLFTGMELTIEAGCLEDVYSAFDYDVDIIVGEVYEPMATDVINIVDVYETGIFNSSNCGYDGSGTVVAILDTGCDYTHTVFSTENFTAKSLALSFDEVAGLVSDTAASRFHESLTANDVYVNEKIPFAYDYADKDTDVMPLSSEHGTHVAGIVAGKNDVITGVAPNAQLAIMKVFSDTSQGAKTSWLLAALEDCVVLGVDVINMSLGAANGFSRELDKIESNKIYDEIKDRGISLVVAAGNSYSASQGSEKNGNLGLTSNPDVATVGSPSTYDASLCVASIDGTDTFYLLYNGSIIYYNEAANRVGEDRNFVDDLLGEGVESMDIEYVLIPGVGRDADYTGIDVNGKIALVSRGDTTFEEKANTAQKMGAAGVIIYNNVSGDIKMTVGDSEIAVCSISQDDGELLAAAGSGTIKVSRAQAAGPFMSGFSSWGPGPGLEIKPEITAHGGFIRSAIPGEEYDVLSGTSMAAPNAAGLTTLVRQYVIETFFADKKDEQGNLSREDRELVTAMVNRLMMSTADVVLNKNGLPYSVRKQGAGLANLTDILKTDAYILTYDREDGSVMDKSKIELGDDPQKTGVYNLKFAIENFGSAAVSYSLGYHVMTEGVAETLTAKGETTVTGEGYVLEGASVAVTSISGGAHSGSIISVGAGNTAEITVTITLTDANKKYLDESFKNGMYVEGFLTFTAQEGTDTDLCVPYLAFYGDWTQAPIFDKEYYETNKDELDESLDTLDKTLPDAYATRPVGALYKDYISYLGSYYYKQKPGTTLISADKKYISLSNQKYSPNSLEYIWAGLLRNVERAEVTIVDDATGEVVYETVDYGIRKSGSRGVGHGPASIDVEFSILDHELKNNSRYTVTVKTFLDYKDGGADTNKNNVFTFPFVTDFEAPVLTDVEFYTEYDKVSKTNKLFAKMAIYDNHYAMSAIPGYISKNEEDKYTVGGFDSYFTQIYSDFNSTSYVIYELTDYLDDIEKKAYNKNTFSVVLLDYALNQSVYEVSLPDDFVDLYFEEEEIKLSPNQLYDLKPVIYPGTEWTELINYSSSDESVVKVVGTKIVAVDSGNATVHASVTLESGVTKTADLDVTVLAKGDEGYRRFDKPVVSDFELTGYKTIKAFYMLSGDDREIGVDDSTTSYTDGDYELTLYPSESVKLLYELVDYFDNTEVQFQSSNEDIVTVDEEGVVVGVAEGFATITLKVLADGKSTYYSQSVSIEVKDPYVNSAATLTHYYGNGGEVRIPESLKLTMIGDYAFSNYEYVEKDLSAGDVIDEEDPYNTKIAYIGEDTITSVIIPEGIESIGAFAFAGLTSLERVVLPSTMRTIAQGAFEGCTSLTNVELADGTKAINAKFINEKAFYNTNLNGTYELPRAIGIAEYAFAGNTALTEITLPESTRSIGAYAFSGNTALKTVTVNADKIKLAEYAFENCSALTSFSLNASVVPLGAFSGCTSLKEFAIGKDVAEINGLAFKDTKIAAYTLDSENEFFSSIENGKYLLSKDGSTLLLAATTVDRVQLPGQNEITAVGNGAFAGNSRLAIVELPAVTTLGDYAFASCSSLIKLTLGELTSIGDYALYGTGIKNAPSLEKVTFLGDYAFAESAISSVSIPAGFSVGKYAFYNCDSLKTVTVGDGAVLDEYAFAVDDTPKHYTILTYVKDGETIYYLRLKSAITSLTIGDGVTVGDYAFSLNASLQSVALGEDAIIGNYAFYGCTGLSEIDLSKAISIGEGAFAGPLYNEFVLENGELTPAIEYDESGLSGRYLHRKYSTALTSVNLSSLESLGKGAFRYCESLTSVILGDSLTVIPDYAFCDCILLSSANLSKVVNVGEAAFGRTALTAADLSSATEIGKQAFAENEALTSVTLGENVTTVKRSAFEDCAALVTVNGLENVEYFEDLAFAGTALTSANLTSAVELGALVFAKDNAADFSVTLSGKLVKIGDNPFAGCLLDAFYTVTEESFNGNTVSEIKSYNYDISETVKVIDGSIYRVVPKTFDIGSTTEKGLELITYCGNGGSFKVADYTVRISDRAFFGTDVTDVLLPYTVSAIGDKAFFGCEKLSIVTFTSYNAPAFEESYDYDYYMDPDTLPCAPNDEFGYGLGILDFHSYSFSSPSNTFFGANFIDYIGQVNRKIVMVRPENGQNYDTYTSSHYFITVINGATAAEDATLLAIAAINRIPEKVALTDEATVALARAAYDKIATKGQQALVDNIAVLTSAEKRIEDLKYLANPPAAEPEQPPVDNTPDEPQQPTEEPGSPWIVIAIIGGSVILLAAAAVCVLIVLKKKGILFGAKKEPASSDVAEDEKLSAEEAPAEEAGNTADEE